MKVFGWAVVVAGVLLQYALIAYYPLPVPRALWLGFPAAVLGMVVGLALSWLGYGLLFFGGLGKRAAELDEEAAAMAREAAQHRDMP